MTKPAAPPVSPPAAPVSPPVSPPAAPAASPAAAPLGPPPPALAARDVSPPDDVTTGDECPARVDGLPAGEHVGDHRLQRGTVIVVMKAARQLMLYRAGELVVCERAALGFAPRGHKERQGDGRTPEGWYRTSDKPWSSFANAIAIHYPNRRDAEAGFAARTITRKQRDLIVAADRARKLPPQTTGLGGAVLIHGGGSNSDWTLGCVALEDEDLLGLRAALGGSMRADLLVLP